jgi:hypothetical protein
MARRLSISGFECDCGHQSLFGIGTVREMEADSLRRRKTMELWDSSHEDHAVEFVGGQAVAMICPKLGRCKIGPFE